MLKVEPEDGWFRMYVQSRSRGSIKHLVDLSENNFQGWCGCENHAFKIQKRYDAKERVPFEERCKHVQAAIPWWFEVVAPTIAMEMDKQALDNADVFGHA